MNNHPMFQKIYEECVLNRLDSEPILLFIKMRSAHYAEKLGIEQETIIRLWEEKRNFYIPNYYQDAHFPLLNDGNTIIVQNMSEFKQKFPSGKFKCLKHHVLNQPYYCDECQTHSAGMFNFGQVKVISIDDFERRPKPEYIFQPVEFK